MANIGLEKILKANDERTEYMLLYQLLGHFGDRLPQDVQVEIRRMATNKEKRCGKFEKNVAKSLGYGYSMDDLKNIKDITNG